MTTRPKPRRFRLRLSDPSGNAPAPAVAPLREDVRPPARPPAPPPRPPAGSGAGSAAELSDELAPRPAAPAPPPLTPQAQTPAPQARPPQHLQAGPQQAGPARTQSPQPAPLPATPPRAEAPSPAQAQPRPAPPPGPPAGTAASPVPRHGADLEGSASAEAELEAIRAEQLTGRQLRMAQRIAQKNGIRATTGAEAVRLLRQRGIDPFRMDTILDTADEDAAQDILPDDGGAAAGSGSRALTRTEQPQLPKTRPADKPPARPGPGGAPKGPSPEQRTTQIRKVQRDIARRRRRRLLLLVARLWVFVFLPTLIAGYYFFAISTPLYATNSEFVIQQADSAGPQGMPGMGSMLAGTGMATSQDSVTVQSFLQSREAMRRLDAEHGFKAHFQRPEIDPLRRLAMDVTDEGAYRLYQRMVRISYDPTEGIIRMEVIAADPETSERFARALVNYAEEQVDQLTQRLRENQMRDAMASVELAEDRNREAQMRVLELQERFQVLSGEVEVTLLTQQITTLEGQLNQERLSLSDLRANSRPQAARVAQSERRIATLEDQIRSLRGSLTQGGGGGQSVARVQRELVMAEADVVTRQLLLQQAMTQLESARIEANRQVRYLSMGVSPIAPDEASYPRKYANTALAFLSFAGIYLLMAMTASILREQVTG